jgi:hypothetical protein
MHVGIKLPARVAIIGSSGSGKTTLLSQLILHENLFNPKPDTILYCAKIEESVPVSLRSRVTFHSGLPDNLKNLNPDGKNFMVVIDDLMNESLNSEEVQDLFLFGRHRNISVVLLTHNIFPRLKYARDISLNTSHFFIMKPSRDLLQLNVLNRQILPDDPHFFSRVFSQHITKPYSYLLIDLAPTTPSLLRFRTNIFDKKISVFIPRNTYLLYKDGAIEKTNSFAANVLCM